MKRTTAIACSGLAAIGVLAVFPAVRASDHLDGPRAIADPQADITDVFAFTSPENARRVVLAMTLVPFAPSAATFSPHVDYVFRVRQVTAPQPLTLDPTPLDVTCTFVDGDGGAQTATCSGPGGMRGQALVGSAAGGSGAMRVFAGRRADPAFFDRQGTLATMATGRTSFTGQNAFAGADVLAIVVEMEAATFSDAGVLPMLAVAAETVRRGR
jgi:hypothetical protein